MNTSLSQVILMLGNAAIHVAWTRVLWSLAFEGINEDNCISIIKPQTMTALMISCIEFFNAVLGLTRSKPHQVLLFASVRAGVEMMVAPLIPCSAFQHTFTILMWSLDGLIRFGCFGFDALLSLLGQTSPPIVKSIRYTAGPLLFPLGAGGEMAMVLLAAKDDRPALYFAASLWPLFFYPLMKQLLKQRAKHFKKLSNQDQDKLK